MQEYYANTGALKRAAQTARGGKAVGCSIVEAYGKVPIYSSAANISKSALDMTIVTL